MSNATDITAKRIVDTNSEGFRADVYDDADGLAILCKGQPTVGFGCRVRQWSKAFALKVLSLQLEEFETPLLNYAWYIGMNDARRSVMTEIAFNQGVGGLLRGYPNLIAACKAEDWSDAQKECTVSTPNVEARYAALGVILLNGTLA